MVQKLREYLKKQTLSARVGGTGNMPKFAMPTDIHALFAMLEAHRLRYVVVGGLALVLHGVDRLTADVDLAVDLAPEAAGRLVETLTEAGFRATAPIDARLLADPDIRAAWYRDRNMQVFSFWDSTGRRPTIDVFIVPPIPFDELWDDAVRIELAADIVIPVASIPHLIRLKELAGRPQDLADIARLHEIVARKGK